MTEEKNEYPGPAAKSIVSSCPHAALATVIAVIQRVKQASVAVAGKEKARIGKGLLALLGVTHQDSQWDIDLLAHKIPRLRIFDDADGKMNLSLREKGGDIIVVSQFTLYGDTQKGNRPSYRRAAPSDVSRPLYERFVEALEDQLGKSVQTGEFGVEMAVSLVNDGPVTLVIDTRRRD